MTRLLLVFLGVLTLLRLASLSQNELAPDEAYYYMWSQRPDISYYSKGPGVATVIRAGTAIFGANEFGIRFFSPIFGLGTSLLVFAFTRRLYDTTVAFWSVLMLNLTPIFNVGSLVMTIDPISIFFWTVALFTFWLALERAPAFSLWWPLTGLAIGLGFLAKYTNALQLLSIVLVLAITSKHRREFARPGLYSLLVVFGLCTLPPIIWNAQHEWITVAHLSARGGLDSAFKLNPLEFLEFLGSHFGVYSPLIFGGILAAIFGTWKSARRQFKPRFLLAFGLPILVLYFALSLKEAGEANWTAPGIVSLGILATVYWIELARERAWARQYAVAGLAIGAAMSLLVVNIDALRAAGIPLSYEVDPSTRMRGWKTAAETVQQLRDRFERETGEPVFLIADTYQTAASLSFYLPEARVEGPGHPAVYIPESQNIENQFSFWPRYDEFLERKPGKETTDAFYTEEAGTNPFLGRNAIYITTRERKKPQSQVRNGFQDYDALALFEVWRRGLPLRQYRVFVCYDYRTLPL